MFKFLKKFAASLSSILVFSILSVSCDWMQNNSFMNKIENEVHDANAEKIPVYIRYANSRMGSTEPQGNTTMKVDVASAITAVTNDDYGFVKWAAFKSEDFPVSKQHSSLYYVNEADYNQNFKPYELDSSVVEFSSPETPATTVKIHQNRSDIFIIPVVARRPTYVQSVPSNGRSGVVRNSSIRILFSKPLLESSLQDSDGNSNITVTSGSAVLTDDDDGADAREITDLFDISLSKSKKMITLKLKEGEYLDNNSQITITIYEEVSDTDGYNMNGNYSFSFVSGTKMDSLSPFIDVIMAGIGENCTDYVPYMTVDPETGEKYKQGESTDAAEAAPANVTSYNTETEGYIFNQRVKDHLNIYVRAMDIAGAGGNVTMDSDTLSESDVALIGIRATLYADKDGNPVTTADRNFSGDDAKDATPSRIPAKTYGYATGVKDKDCLIKSNFEDVVADDCKTNGTLFSYDLSGLDDGLIKIDLWTVDMVGNSSLNESYYTTYDNGYKSIFVVKDSTAPDISTEKAKLLSGSAQAPYSWYNAETLGTMELYDSENSLISDVGNALLSSDITKLKWLFKVGVDSEWKPEPDDSAWKKIHDSDSKPSHYKMTDAEVPETDGPVKISMALMDDICNISDVILLDSIMFDKTRPAAELNTEGNWVNASGTVLPEVTTNQILTHILKLPFTEEASGIRRIEIHVKDSEGNDVEAPLSGSGFEILYAPSSIQNAVPSSSGVKKLSFDANDETASDNMKVLKVNDSSKVTTGTLFIKGLTIGEPDGTYTVTVDLYDSAMNRTESTVSTFIARDSVKPEVEKIYIPDLKKSKELKPSSSSSTGTDGWYLSKDYVGGSGKDCGTSDSSYTPGKVPLYITLKEQHSGVKSITFSKDVQLFTSAGSGSNAHGVTKIYLIEEDEEGKKSEKEIPSDHYSISGTTITMGNAYTLKASDSFVILVKDVGLKNVLANEVGVTVSDLAENTGNTLNSISTSDAEDAEKVTKIYSDYNRTRVYSISLSDRAGMTKLSASSGYTNEQYINLAVSSHTSYKDTASGINVLSLTAGAVFTNDTVMKISNETVDSKYFEFSTDKTRLSLRDPETGEYLVIRGAYDIQLFNVLLSSASEESHTVTLMMYDLAGWDGTAASGNIIFDKTKPSIEKGMFTSNFTHEKIPCYVPSVNVYPHADGETAYGLEVEYTSGSKKLKVPTFYTSTAFDVDVTASKGEVSLKTGSKYGAVLGIRAKDNIGLGGSVRGKTFLYYIQDADFTKTASDIISSGTNPASDINSLRIPGTTVDSNKSTALNFAFYCGNYSAVVVDEAGNISDVFHFAVVQDTARPDVSDFNSTRVLLQKPDVSSNIYRNGTEITMDPSDLKCTAYGFEKTEITSRFRTRKYVTKKSTSKYRIILNLGTTYSSSNLVSKLNGSNAGSVTEYKELKPSSSSAPIEKYAVSTLYGSWPADDDSKLEYVPVVPYETVFPSGQVQNSGTITSAEATMACLYFGGEETFLSTWRSGSNYNSWYNYKPASGNSKNYDSGSGIYSYVDSNNNLVLELPQSTTAPVSVFLRDGCGNMNYVVLGLETKDEKKTAPSFVVDDRLGAASTSNGEVTTPVVMQNPHMVYPPVSTDKVQWNGIYFEWNKQSGNGDHANDDGVGEEFGFMKDKVKNITYYNPRLYVDTAGKIKEYSASDKKYWSKIALTLRSSVAEDVLFGSDEHMPVVNADANASPNSSKDYTCRALLYCTTDSEAPSYSDIVNSHIEGSSGSTAIKKGDTGFRTEWIGVKYASSDSITILLDYPQPDYETLGWTVNDSTTHECKPFYLWYIFEDRVGNYEIGKVVNSKIKGSSLKSSLSGFDKWLYDGKAPVVTVAGTEGKRPDEITNTESDVKHLVSGNNGYVTYLDADNKRIWISSDPDRESRGSSFIKAPSGWGVTNVVEDGSGTVEKRQYLPFVNLELSSEITGIRAFCWTKNENAPAYNKFKSDNNTQGEYQDSENPQGCWYPGSGISGNGTKVDIGFTYDYTNPVNAFYDYTGSSYKNRYSGTKINTVIPYALLSDSSDSVLYLHVMDWTGNIATYRMGSKTSGLTFRNDNRAPASSSGSFTGISVPNQYYISKNTSQNPVLRIAGNGTFAKSESAIKVYIPAGALTESGAGILGYSFENTGISCAEYDENGPYLEIPFAKYSASTSQNLSYYIYDKVGNVSAATTMSCIYDTVAPEIGSVSLVISRNSNSQATFCDAENGIGKNENNYSDYGSYRDYSRAAEYHDSADDITAEELQVVYISRENSAKFHINFADPEDNTKPKATDDLYEIQINKWNATASRWETVSSSVANSSLWKPSGTNQTNSVSMYMGKTASTGYDILTYDADGVYYQVLAVDLSGNTSCRYFKLYLDSNGPEFKSAPAVTAVKGSVNSDGTNYYYNEMNVSFALSDSLPDSLAAAYRIDGGSWTEGTADERTITVAYSEKNISKPEVEAKDILGNQSKAKFSVNNQQVTLPFVCDKTPPAAVATFDDKTYKNHPYTFFFVEYDDWYSEKSSFTIGGYEYGYVLDEDKENLSASLNISESYLSGNDLTFTPYTSKTETGYSDIMGFIEGNPVNEPGYYNSENVYKSFSYKLGEAIKLNGTKYEKKFYAVDYAGNVSEKPFKLTICYNNGTVPKNLKLDKVEPEAETAVFYNEESKTVYYNSATVFIKGDQFSKDKKYNVTALRLYVDGELYAEYTDKDEEKQLKSETEKKANVSGRYDFTVSFKLPNDISTASRLSCVLLCNNNKIRSSEFDLVIQNEEDKWVVDKTSPELTSEEIKIEAVSEHSYYSEGTVWTDSEQTESVKLRVAVSAEDNASGIKGWGTSFSKAVGMGEAAEVSDGDMIFVYDNAGNSKKVTDVEFKADETKPEDPTVIAFVDETKTVVNPYEDDGRWYFNADVVKYVGIIGSTDEGSGLKGYVVKLGENGQQIETVDGYVSTELISGDTVFYAAAVDKVGNTSGWVYGEIISDSDEPSLPEKFKNSTEGKGSSVSFDAENRTLKITWAKNAEETELEPVGCSDETSGLKGYSIGKDGEITETITIKASDFKDGNKNALELYAHDNVGHSVKIATLTSKTDEKGPEAAKGTYEYSSSDNITRIYSYDILDDAEIDLVQDNELGNGWYTNLYTSGTKIAVSLTEKPSAYSWHITDDLKPLDTVEWNKNIEWKDSKLTVELPDIKVPHKNLLLLVRDKAGNMNYYSIAHNSKDGKNYSWWLEYEDISDENLEITASYTAKNKNYDVTVNLPENMTVSVVRVSNSKNVYNLDFGYDKGNEPNLEKEKIKNNGNEIAMIALHGKLSFTFTIEDEDEALKITLKDARGKKRYITEFTELTVTESIRASFSSIDNMFGTVKGAGSVERKSSYRSAGVTVSAGTENNVITGAASLTVTAAEKTVTEEAGKQKPITTWNSAEAAERRRAIEVALADAKPLKVYTNRNSEKPEVLGASTLETGTKSAYKAGFLPEKMEMSAEADYNPNGAMRKRMLFILMLIGGLAGITALILLMKKKNIKN